MAPAPLLTFGPRRSPIRIARIFGSGACLFGIAGLALGILTAHQSWFLLCFFGLMGVCVGAFGAWLAAHGQRLARLRAEVRSDGLLLTAHSGRHVWFQRGLATARIPWADIQGFTSMRTMNMSAKSGSQATYILYTRQGDFTLVDLQWENLDGLLGEITARTGRAPETVAEERAAAKAEIQAGERKVYVLMRGFGWAAVIVCVPMAVVVLIEGVAQGFSRDVGRGLCLLVIACSIGSSMIRYYRK